MKNPLKSIASCRTLIHSRGFTGKDAFCIFFDFYYCRKKFHCTSGEYFGYRFYELRDCIRKNYLLRYHQRIRYGLVDRSGYKLSGKENINVTFHDKIMRQWMRVDPDDLTTAEAFVRKYGKAIFKPVHGSQGDGIFALTADELGAGLQVEHPELTQREYICEEYVIQHPKMAEMNPASVNTVRVTTLCDGDTVKMVFGSLRTGAGDGVCDNLSIGGVGAVVDMETGILTTGGIDFDKKQYFYHPVSGVKMLGFELPYWDEVKKLVNECALRVSEIAVVGWDIAITEDGPCLIEANNRPAAGKAAQIATHRPQGEEIINYIDNNWRKYHKKLPKGYRKAMKRWG